MQTIKNKSSLHEYHAELLGLRGGWKVGSIVLDSSSRTIFFQVEVDPETRVECPDCGALCWISDFTDEQEWRLSLLCFKAVIRCRVPRADCPEHGVSRAAVPWSKSTTVSHAPMPETEGEQHEKPL